MYSVSVGDLVKFKAKYHGPDTPDQWAGLTGIILEIIEASGSRAALSVLVNHPDESAPIPIFAFIDDVEKIE
tara:strand:- start:143 stop:358 length:216 start_codon:yes stop_codon:yes gene_type:complete